MLKIKTQYVDLSTNRIYTDEYLDILASLGGSRVKVFVYILKTMSRSGKMYKTIQQVAKENNVAYTTAFNVFKTLQQKELIKKVGYVWIATSKLIITSKDYNEGIKNDF